MKTITALAIISLAAATGCVADEDPGLPAETGAAATARTGDDDVSRHALSAIMCLKYPTDAPSGSDYCASDPNDPSFEDLIASSCETARTLGASRGMSHADLDALGTDAAVGILPLIASGDLTEVEAVEVVALTGAVAGMYDELC